MLEVMTEFNIRNVVFSSTAAVYGNPIKSICEEDDPTLPISPYGDSKLASEKLIKWVCNAYNMNYCIFRYFNVAGADESLEIGLNNTQTAKEMYEIRTSNTTYLEDLNYGLELAHEAFNLSSEHKFKNKNVKINEKLDEILITLARKILNSNN